MEHSHSRPLGLAGLILRAGRVGVAMLTHGVVHGVVRGGEIVTTRLRGHDRGRGLRDGERWTRLLTQLGPFYIKVGQLLSTRRDLLPDEVTAPLSRLTDACKPPRRRQVERAVRDAYQDRPWPFREFTWQPVASGSIATVHRAVTLDGRRVAVKVRRPGIETMMRRDFLLSSTALRLLKAVPSLRRLPLNLMHDQVGSAILRQLDFTAELAALSSLRSNLAEVDGVRIPAPLPGLCTANTVVMEYIDDLATFEPEALDTRTRRTAARVALTATYEMLFVHGFVHCDLHPGNLYVDRGAGLVMLDAGFVVQLPDKVRRSFADFFLNMAMGNGPMCAEVVIDSASHIAETCDLEAFRAELSELVETASGARSGEFDLARFAGALFDMQRRFGLFPAPEFAFPLLSLLVIEGMIKDFDADIDFQAAAVPVLSRRNVSRQSASRIPH